MKKCLALSVLAVQAFAAQQTWTGQITETMCGADHNAMAQAGKPVNAHDCTIVCKKAGAKFALLTSGKVLEIANQNYADLEKHAGAAVRVTGEVSSDGKTITVSKLAAK